jgi:hypothetical protein
MGMDLVLKYGLKAFLDKFRRKRIGSEPAVNFYHSRMAEVQAESSSCELIFLLADMIRSTGGQNGAEQKLQTNT